MKIGYQGVPGAYSEAALQRFFLDYDQKDLKLHEYSNFKILVGDIVQEKIDYAVIPIENSTTGLISRSVDLFRYQPVTAVAEILQPIQHVLWGVKDSRIEDLKTVYSHPEALAQCQSFFEEYPHIQPFAFEDTAKAALWVARNQDKKIGALASQRAGELYKLDLLKRDIQTEISNTTRFFIMRHSNHSNDKGKHLVLYIETLHQPGALSKILQTFDLFNCNLEALNARPIPGQPFNYGFFIEVNIEHLTSSLVLLQEVLEQASEYVQLIGRF